MLELAFLIRPSLWTVSLSWKGMPLLICCMASLLWQRHLNLPRECNMEWWLVISTKLLMEIWESRIKVENTWKNNYVFLRRVLDRLGMLESVVKVQNTCLSKYGVYSGTSSQMWWLLFRWLVQIIIRVGAIEYALDIVISCWSFHMHIDYIAIL